MQTLHSQELSLDDIGGYLSAGYTGLTWEPAVEEPDSVFSYDTEGLGLVTLRSGLSFRGIDAFRFKYERPFEQTERQADMLEAYRESSVIDAENLLFGISISPLASVLGVYDTFTFENWFLSILFSIEYERLVSRFYGSARAEQDLYFFDLDGEWSYFDEGDRMNFVSDMTSTECTVDLLGGWFADFGTDIVIWDPRQLSSLEEFIVVSLIRSPQVRIGLFDVDYRRPTAFGQDITVNDGMETSAAFAADYGAQGYVVGFRRARREIDGLNMDLAFRRSTRSDIDAYYVPAESEIEFQSTEVDLWYQLPLSESAKIVAGCMAETSTWSYEVEDDFTNQTEEVVFDSDEFGTAYVNFSWSF